jgi:Na+/H+ antiporter NhaC
MDKFYPKTLLVNRHSLIIKYVKCIAMVFTVFTTFYSLNAQKEGLVSSQSWSKISVAADNVYLHYPNSTADQVSIKVNGEKQTLSVEDGIARLPVTPQAKGQLLYLTTTDKRQLIHLHADELGQAQFTRIPLWLSILPPLVAIGLALLLKEVIISLFVGVWMGAFIAGGLRWTSLWYYFESLFSTLQKYVVQALNHSGHLSVIVFSLLIGGMVAIISKNGGMAGVVLQLSKYAKGRKSTQFVTWLLGVAIFFDDYANTLIVGNTMRAVTDRFRISREKLAYIVDSTAAPIAAVAFITTWIGAELGYIESGLDIIEGWTRTETPYSIFLQSLKYSFYPILTLSFILMLIYQERDYGPMWRAEQRAIQSEDPPEVLNSNSENQEEDLSPLPNSGRYALDAIIPILAVILITMLGLWMTGMYSTWEEMQAAGIDAPRRFSAIWSGMDGLWSEPASVFMKLGKVIGLADSYVGLLWGSLSGVILAILISAYRGSMKLTEGIHWMSVGFKTMLPAILILTMAWSLAITTEELQTADFLASLVQDSLNPYFLPPLVFILSAVIAFSTGSSWSTMAILFPIAIPTSWAVSQGAGLPPDIAYQILLNVIATVLAASVLGDHCSPISDTTILSSLASGCDHIEHVRTQLPYALTVGLVSLLCVFLATFLGGSWGVSILLLFGALIILWFWIRWKGRALDTTDRP